MNWNEIVKDVPKLSSGNHDNFGPELCFMEMTAFLAGEPHSDHPKCASPVLTQFGITLNDNGQAFRDALAPVVVEMIGSANPALEQERVEYLVFNVAKRILPLALKGLVGQELIDAILKADDLVALRDAAYTAYTARATTYTARAAADAADAADAACAAADAVDAACATRAAAYTACATADTARAAAIAADAGIPQIATDILLEAIRLDPNKKPAEIDMSRVEVLREMVSA